jgi:5-methylcytosine-specific restriction endonuclease McrA
MPRGQADIANTALRIFLQEMGAAYDGDRGLRAYGSKGDFEEVRAFFGARCCYCGAEFGPERRAVQDHLIPMNKTDAGLHAWGNVVPSCDPCNAKKQGRDWREFMIERAGEYAAERHARVKDFVLQYRYDPSLDLKSVAAELYEEVGNVSMTLIQTKIRRAQRTSIKEVSPPAA